MAGVLKPTMKILLWLELVILIIVAFAISLNSKNYVGNFNSGFFWTVGLELAADGTYFLDDGQDSKCTFRWRPKGDNRYTPRDFVDAGLTEAWFSDGRYFDEFQETETNAETFSNATRAVSVRVSADWVAMCSSDKDYKSNELLDRFLANRIYGFYRELICIGLLAATILCQLIGIAFKHWRQRRQAG